LDKVKEHLAEANARVKSLTVSEQDYREQLEVSRACVIYTIIYNKIV